MRLTKGRIQFLVAGAIMVALAVVVMLWGPSRTTAPATAAVTPLAAAPVALATPAPAAPVPVVATPPSASKADYDTALRIWDGALTAGDAGDASHWLAAGMLMNRGDYAGAREQLQAVLSTAPAGSPVALKAQMMLAGTAGGKKLIALAFDDFPFQNGSQPILDLLSKAHVPVTYFCIGHKVNDFPDLVAEAAAQGNSMQNHTFHHLKLSELTADQVRAELNLCNDAIRKITGVTPRYLRGPHAATNATVDREVRDCGLTCVDPIVTNIYDMGESAEGIYGRCVQRAKPGAIMDMHDGLPTTAKALPRVIATLRAKGYEFVTVDQLLGGSPPVAHPAPRPVASTPAAALSSWGSQFTPATASTTDPDAGTR